MEHSPRGKHDWREASAQTRAAYEASLELQHNAIFFVGRTGAGKSTALHILGAKAKICHGFNSGTKLLTAFSVPNDSSIYIDTQGTADSSGTQSMDETLAEMLKQLLTEKVKTIQVFWLVNGDATRMDDNLQREAAFIASLGPGVFQNSTVIINTKSNGTIDGLVAAAIGNLDRGPSGGQKWYCTDQKTIRARVLGVTLVGSQYHNPQHVQKMYEMAHKAKASEQDLAEMNLYTESMYKSLLKRMIAQTKQSPMAYPLVECHNCSISGDPRVQDRQTVCHWQCRHYHPSSCRRHGSTSRRHPGGWSTIQVDQRTIYDHLNATPFGWGNVFHLHPATHVIRLFQSNKREESFWSCCKDPSYNSQGCEEYCNACNQSSGSVGCYIKCTRCGKEERGDYLSGGCLDECNKCNKPWRTSICAENKSKSDEEGKSDES